MTIKVNILYPSLRQFTGNQEVVKANGKTIGECLGHLVKQFPGIERGYSTSTVNCSTMFTFSLMEKAPIQLT